MREEAVIPLHELLDDHTMLIRFSPNEVVK